MPQTQQELPSPFFRFGAPEGTDVPITVGGTQYHSCSAFNSRNNHKLHNGFHGLKRLLFFTIKVYRNNSASQQLPTRPPWQYPWARHPSNKYSVLSTLVHRAQGLSDNASLNNELKLLNDTFKYNSDCRVLNPAVAVAQPNDMPDSAAFLPYVRSTSNCVNRVLSKSNIKSVGVLLRNISKSFLQLIEDDLGLRTPGVCSIPCNCCQVYI
jgi:hypothetical protein